MRLAAALPAGAIPGGCKLGPSADAAPPVSQRGAWQEWVAYVLN
jgi:hypothetical protein